MVSGFSLGFEVHGFRVVGYMVSGIRVYVCVLRFGPWVWDFGLRIMAGVWGLYTKGASQFVCNHVKRI